MIHPHTQPVCVTESRLPSNFLKAKIHHLLKTIEPKEVSWLDQHHTLHRMGVIQVFVLVTHKVTITTIRYPGQGGFLEVQRSNS